MSMKDVISQLRIHFTESTLKIGYLKVRKLKYMSSLSR
jgi:hypothetical protein